MLTSTPKKNWTILIASAPFALAQSLAFATDDNNAVVAAKSATAATTQLVNSFSTASFFGGGAFIELQVR